MTIVWPVASASAMMPREIAWRTVVDLGVGEAVRDPPARSPPVGVVVQLEIALPGLDRLDHQGQRLAQKRLQLPLLAELQQAQREGVLALQLSQIDRFVARRLHRWHRSGGFTPAGRGLSSAKYG